MTTRQKKPRSWRARARKAGDSTDVGLYASRVLDGTIAAGPMVRAACKRHIVDLETASARGLRWSNEKALRVFRFFEQVLYLPESSGPEPELFKLELWQRFILGSLFGWLRDDGYRRFRTAYVEVGKGNGKSPMAAGVGLYGLTSDEEPGAQVYAAAVTQDQAKILFRDAEMMVGRSPLLRDEVMSRINNLSVEHSFSFFRPVSAEHRALDGKRVHMGLIDEVHEHPTPLVVDKMRAGTKGRPQAMIFEITNSGYDRTSVCWHHHDYSRQVVEGVTENDSWFAYVCELDPGDNPLDDESCWLKANPNLGVSIPHRYLRQQVAEAIGMPSAEAIIRRLNFCQWTKQHTKYINMDHWRACDKPLPTEVELAREPCYAGLDLGKRDDFAALVLIWPMMDGRIVIRPRFWIPSEAVEHTRSTRPYEYWETTGALEVTPGQVIDFDTVEAAVREECMRFSVRQLGYDERYAEHMRQHLEGQGLGLEKVAGGFNLNEALVTLSSKLVQQVLVHAGHPVLTWMADNFVVRMGNYGQIRPDKEAADEKIDGMVALVNAVHVWINDDAGSRDPLYADRGALFLS